MTGTVRVEYLSATTALNGQIQYDIDVVNVSNANIAINQIEVRYYFERENTGVDLTGVDATRFIAAVNAARKWPPEKVAALDTELRALAAEADQKKRLARTLAFILRTAVSLAVPL